MHLEVAGHPGYAGLMSLPGGGPHVRIEPWSADDLALLVRCNAPEMMVHLGGPETDEQLQRRHARYLDGWRTGAAHVFHVIVDGCDGSGPSTAGIVSYWRSTWRDEPTLEAGWCVLPERQGAGVATLATVAAVRDAAARRASTGDIEHRVLHAFPKIDNTASNGVCRRAGLTWGGECGLEYPPGNPIRCNDWFVDLDSVAPVQRRMSDLS